MNKNHCKKFFLTIETNSLSTFSFLSIIFKSNGCVYLCLVYGYKKNVVDLDEFDFNGVSVFSFKTDYYASRVFPLNISLETILGSARTIVVNTIFPSRQLCRS